MCDVNSVGAPTRGSTAVLVRWRMQSFIPSPMNYIYNVLKNSHFEWGGVKIAPNFLSKSLGYSPKISYICIV